MTKSGKVILISGIVLGVAIIGFLVYNNATYGTYYGGPFGFGTLEGDSWQQGELNFNPYMKPISCNECPKYCHKKCKGRIQKKLCNETCLDVCYDICVGSE